MPQIDWGWFGFPCTDVSVLNPLASSNGQVVEQGALRTGRVFRASVHFVEAQAREQLELLFCENVLGLMHRTQSTGTHTNLQSCIRFLQEAAFYVVVFLLCPSMFSKPVSRPRIWIVAIPMSLAGCVPSSVLDQKAVELMDFVVRTAAESEKGQPLDFHLLTETDPRILQHLWSLQQRAAAATDDAVAELRHKRPKPASWVEKHRAWCIANNIEWCNVGLPPPPRQCNFIRGCKNSHCESLTFSHAWV